MRLAQEELSMKKQKGISMISLIITIIVLIILALIVIRYSFTKTLDDSAFTRKVSEMTEVYDAVIQRGIEHKIDEDLYPYEGTKLLDSDPLEINGVKYGDGYYHITSDEHKARLNLERVKGNYVVNYSTGEIVSEIKVSYEGKDYYRLSDISNAVQPSNTAVAAGEYDSSNGVNMPVLSYGMVPVVGSGDEWVVTTQDGEWYDYGIGKYATIMLIDELAVEGYSNDAIRKMSNSEIKALSGKKVIVPGSTFIWIPRYTYKEDASGEKQIVYSKLLEDYTKDGFVKHPAFYFGEYKGATDIDKNSGYVGGGKELTGIWISKYEAGYNI